MDSACTPHHDLFNTVLTFGLCCGLVISYLPQHYRIIHTKSSEGLSPVFLLLGVSSALFGMFNMITLQAPIVRCCRVVSLGTCVEMSLGVLQVGLQWACFTIIFILYMLYYPEHLRYVTSTTEETELPPIPAKLRVKSDEWRISIVVAWILGLNFAIVILTTAYLLATTPDSPTGDPPARIAAWATFLGVSSAVLACIQYAPQLKHTYRTKLVGALSIPMMMIQTPGGILMVTSIVLRPGTNWTSWATFAVAAILQGCLLCMCIFWKIRQRKLSIDDFGNPIDPGYFPPQPWAQTEEEGITESLYSPQTFSDGEEPVPGLATSPSVDPLAVRVALSNALGSAADSNLLSPPGGGQLTSGGDADEETPLLRRQDLNGRAQQTDEERGWSAWFGR